MTTINLRKCFPEYGFDCFVEVPDEDVDAYVKSLTTEIAHAFFEEEPRKLAAQRKMCRYKAQYSLDCDDGIETDALETQDDPLTEILQSMEIEQLYAALNTLPTKQSQRIYAHYVLGVSKTAIAEREGKNMGLPSSSFNSIQFCISEISQSFKM